MKKTEPIESHVAQDVVHRHLKKMSTPRGCLEFYAQHRNLARIMTERMMGVSEELPEEDSGPPSAQRVRRRREFAEIRQALSTEPAVTVLERFPHHDCTIVTLRMGLSGHWPIVWHEADVWLQGIEPIKPVVHGDVSQASYEAMMKQERGNEDAIGREVMSRPSKLPLQSPPPSPVATLPPIATEISAPAQRARLPGSVAKPSAMSRKPTGRKSRLLEIKESTVEESPLARLLQLDEPSGPIVVDSMPVPAVAVPSKEALSKPTSGVSSIPALRRPTREKLPPKAAPLVQKAEPAPQPPAIAPHGAILHCIHCGERHVDKGVWLTQPHIKHSCESCGKTWEVRPACYGIEPVKKATQEPKQARAAKPIQPPAEMAVTPRERRVDRAEQLNERGTRRRLEWTPADDELLRTHYATETAEQIAERLNRTSAGVKIRAKKLGITRKRALAVRDIYPTTMIARLMKVDQKCVSWWGELGLNIQPSGLHAGKNFCQLIAIKDLEDFLNSRPEVFEASRVDWEKLEQMGCHVLEDTKAPPWKVKRVECPAIQEHATNLPLAFFVPFKTLSPQCPCCGRMLGRQAIGSTTESRYRLRGKALEPYRLVSAAGAKMLRIIANLGGRSDVGSISDLMRSRKATREEIYSDRQVLGRMAGSMVPKMAPLLTCEAKPIKGSTKGQPRVFFEFSQQGLDAIEALREFSPGEKVKALKLPFTAPVIEQSTEPSRSRRKHSKSVPIDRSPRTRDAQWTRGAQRWTTEEDEYLLGHWQKIRTSEVSRHLSRSVRSITQRAATLKLPRTLTRRRR